MGGLPQTDRATVDAVPRTGQLPESPGASRCSAGEGVPIRAVPATESVLIDTVPQAEQSLEHSGALR